eukprot:TRINITY_DN93366_c0_g1_i1.p1 TRINITY_DN93366_c0_g1~~TRINITY_DN93366_c0_g1_i1.p1  ORF type:complete len:536 (-),score=107.08 TRINITY_DN93366_c0_g1_i1:49-1656(-)
MYGQAGWPGNPVYGHPQHGFYPGGPPDGGWQPPVGAVVPPTDAGLNRISQEFTHEDIVLATQSFSGGCRLGEGTYGTVWSGVLRDGTEVAIKTLVSPKEGGFREEVEVLSRFRHPNLVILLGFARNGRERYLVYELLPGGDLHSRLMKDAKFTAKGRVSVCLDAALGLSHLHGSRPQVFHRDIKSQNILLDRNGTGKVADFGLACLAQQNQKSLLVSQTSGTIGYADPLYIRTGRITERSEVYSMGMVLLEVLTGRPPALQHPSGRIEYQFEHVQGDLNRVRAMVDPKGQWMPALVDRIGKLALRCISEPESLRPSFVDVVKELRLFLRDDALYAVPAAAAPMPQAPLGAAVSRGHGGAQGISGGAAQDPRVLGGAAYNARPLAAAVNRHPANVLERGDGTANAGAAVFRQDAREARQQPQAAASPWLHRNSGAAHAEAAAQPQGRASWNPFASPQDAQPRRGYAAPTPYPAEEATMPVRLQPAAASGGEGDTAGRASDIEKVISLGFERHQAVEAFKRCSTVEAAVEFIVGREW